MDGSQVMRKEDVAIKQSGGWGWDSICIACLSVPILNVIKHNNQDALLPPGTHKGVGGKGGSSRCLGCYAHESCCSWFVAFVLDVYLASISTHARGHVGMAAGTQPACGRHGTASMLLWLGLAPTGK